jgi:hypothetical protein
LPQMASENAKLTFIKTDVYEKPELSEWHSNRGSRTRVYSR